MAFNSNITFIGCVEFVNNHPEQPVSDVLREIGAITLIQSSAFFNGNCNLKYNQAGYGGALLSTESKVYVNGDVIIACNRAVKDGGGIYLSNSELICLQKSTLVLDNNQAENRGGGLHVISSTIKVCSLYNRNAET